MHKSNVWLASAVIGDRVHNAAGENLGKIEDVVVDPSTGSVLYAVLSFGGIMGMGNKLFAVPWSSLRMSPGRDYLLLDIDRETLERAPGFDPDHWPDMADPVWQRGITDYYGHRHAVGAGRPSARERTVVVTRERPARRSLGLGTAVMLLLLLIGLGWLAWVVNTRGWDAAKREISSSAESAAYAMKETSADATLTTKVKTALSLSKQVSASKINVDSSDNVVTLRGEVPNVEARNMAESIARDVPGVREVRNHLYVLSGTK